MQNLVHGKLRAIANIFFKTQVNGYVPAYRILIGIRVKANLVLNPRFAYTHIFLKIIEIYIE